MGLPNQDHSRPSAASGSGSCPAPPPPLSLSSSSSSDSLTSSPPVIPSPVTNDPQDSTLGPSPQPALHQQHPKDDSTLLPFIPTLATTSPANYGRLDPENESNIRMVNSIPFEMRQHPRLPSQDFAPRPSFSPSYASMADNAATRGSSISFQNLPSELIDAILYWLPPHDLAMLSATCRALHKAATSDSHWRRCVQENVPFHLAKAPGSYVTSYRQLYAAYDRLWFLPKYKIWFSDRNLAGRLVIACFDPRRGCIDGYQLLAVSSERSYADWVGSEEDSEVKIHSFKPYVRLHLDRPIIHFGLDKSSMDFRNQEGNRYANAMPMALDDRENGMFSNFMLTKALDPVKVEEGFRQGFPYGSVWPPPCIPARCHAAGFLPGQPEESHSSYDRPQRRGEVSDQSFHIRQWMEMVGSPAAERAIARSAFNPLNRRHAYQNIGHGALSIHIGEELITYSTLDPSLYTPTPTKPWRGIWVGDYSGHGCEFLLLHQPDDEPATDSDLGLVREEGESDGSWEQRRLEARIYRGRLEAIKLTGDPNIPRGEYTFVADDLGPEGFVKFETAAPFEGVRVVKSKGHVARTGFEEDMFISSHLMLLSHNRLAQYWLEFGHISYFERVNIDNFINPAASSF